MCVNFQQTDPSDSMSQSLADDTSHQPPARSILTGTAPMRVRSRASCVARNHAGCFGPNTCLITRIGSVIARIGSVAMAESPVVITESCPCFGRGRNMHRLLGASVVTNECCTGVVPCVRVGEG